MEGGGGPLTPSSSKGTEPRMDGQEGSGSVIGEKRRMYISIASSTTIGRRVSNEDYHAVGGVKDLGLGVNGSHLYVSNELLTKGQKPSIALADGHNGARMAKVTAKTLVHGLNEVINSVSNEEGQKITADRIRGLYNMIDERQSNFYDKSGCACITLTLSEDWVVCSSLGDCRAITISLMNDKSQAVQTKSMAINETNPISDPEIMINEPYIHIVPLSSDHKPSKKNELMRIQRLGGAVHPSIRLVPKCDGVVFSGPPRTWPGGLSLSRSLGDFSSGKKSIGAYTAKDNNRTDGLIGAIPSVSFWNGGFDWIVVACDGLWDVLDPSLVAKYVIGSDFVARQKSVDPTLFIAEALAKLAYAYGSGDNISVIVVQNVRARGEVKWGQQKNFKVLGHQCSIPFADIHVKGGTPIMM